MELKDISRKGILNICHRPHVNINIPLADYKNVLANGYFGQWTLLVVVRVESISKIFRFMIFWEIYKMETVVGSF